MVLSILDIAILQVKEMVSGEAHGTDWLELYLDSKVSSKLQNYRNPRRKSAKKLP